MLTREQKYVLRRIGIYAYASIERNGKAYYIGKDGKEEEFIIPQFGEILQNIFSQIKAAGFSEIKRCSVRKANCIVRVYQDLHHEYDWGECYNMYGADCYTKTENAQWVTETTITPSAMQFDMHLVTQNLSSDERIVFKTEFLDCPLLIS